MDNPTSGAETNVVPVRPIEEQLTELNTTLDYLGIEIDKLRGRLVPVLDQVERPSEDIAPLPESIANSEVTSRLRGAVIYVRKIQRDVHDLIQRLEI